MNYVSRSQVILFAKKLTLKEFYKSFEDKDITIKSTGYKAFKRWEYFVGPRVYPSGDLSVLAQLSKNYTDFLIENNINKLFI